ncbi:MAG: tetratricopeptide repeat protein, partial [Candidatus Kapaibacterium sp.]
AESAIKTAIHCSPNNVEALVHYAYIREKFLDVKTAIRCYRRAIALDPANVEALLRCARVLHTADERTEAIELARKVLEWNAHSADAHYLLAELYIEEGRLALGLIHTRELFALQPEEKRRFVNIAMSLERAKAMDKAIDVYKRITDTDAEYAEAYYHIGRLAYEGGLLKLSMEMQETLDRVSPEFARLLKKFRDQSLPAVDIAYIEGSSSGLVPVA